MGQFTIMNVEWELLVYAITLVVAMHVLNFGFVGSYSIRRRFVVWNIFSYGWSISTSLYHRYHLNSWVRCTNTSKWNLVVCMGECRFTKLTILMSMMKMLCDLYWQALYVTMVWLCVILLGHQSAGCTSLQCLPVQIRV